MSPRLSWPLAALLLLGGAGASRAAPAKSFSVMPESEIAATLKAIHAKNPSLPGRIEAVSAAFLGTPYRLGPLGEGEKGEFDRDPLVDFKAVDCTTLVEQSMALALEPDLSRAVKTLQKIRYQGGKISYQTRNHFPELDWLPNNIAAGFLRDITAEVGGEATKRVSKNISKREWYAAMTGDGLRKLGERFADQVADIPYVPIELLPQLLDKIPSGTVANLVREARPDKPVLISHQVFLIEKDGARWVRHASSRGQVEDVPALAYFYRYYNSPWPLLGLNLDEVRAPRD